ncbi:MAG: thymidine phosphorylase [Bradymonadia bacterium]
MRVVDLIAKKRNGGTLTDREITELINLFWTDKLPDYQMAAMAMAIYYQGLNSEELSVWTKAMLHSGRVLDFSHVSKVKVDKHSTGGVGDKISLPLAPLVASCGVAVPMISGRGLGHTGGTLDKLESIPGFRTDLSSQRFTTLVEKLGVALGGQTEEICPADKRLYALRDVTATVESIPLIASSIMSKKLAEGIDGLVLDVKVGAGAFMPNVERATELADTMISIGQTMGTKVVALLTRMDAPIGQMVGNALEVAESIEVLRGEGPPETRALTLALAEEMLSIAGKDPHLAQKNLDNGAALRMFETIIEAQDGDPRVCQSLNLLPQASERIPLNATEAGTVSAINAKTVGLAAIELGAGRNKKSDIIDPAVGIEMVVSPGQHVNVGDELCWIHHNHHGVEASKARLRTAFTIGESTYEEKPIVLRRRGG